MDDIEPESDLHATLRMAPPHGITEDQGAITTGKANLDEKTPIWARELRASVVKVPPVPATPNTPPVRRSKFRYEKPEPPKVMPPFKLKRDVESDTDDVRLDRTSLALPPAPQPPNSIPKFGTVGRSDSKLMNTLWEDEDEDLDRLIRTTGLKSSKKSLTFLDWGCSVENCTEGGILYHMGKNRPASVRYCYLTLYLLSFRYIRELAYLEPMEKIYLCIQHYQLVLCILSPYPRLTKPDNVQAEKEKDREKERENRMMPPSPVTSSSASPTAHRSRDSERADNYQPWKSVNKPGSLITIIDLDR